MSLNRRHFMQRMAAFACAGAAAPLSLAGRAYGAAPTSLLPNQRSVVFILLQGGVDTLSLLPPRGSSSPGSVMQRYLTLRPQLGWTTSGANASLPLSIDFPEALVACAASSTSLWSSTPNDRKHRNVRSRASAPLPMRTSPRFTVSV